MNSNLKKIQFIIIISFILIYTIGSLQAHIVIIGSPSTDLPSSFLKDAKHITNTLKSNGYSDDKILTLYGKNATVKNILKSLYNADSVIYIGHGGYKEGHYNKYSNYAISPFSIVGYPDIDNSEFIWGYNNYMRDSNGNLFSIPTKNNAGIFLYHVCFSTGYVGTKEVKNPAQTIYSFARMFGITTKKTNYYASSYFYGSIIGNLLTPSKTIKLANSQIQTQEKIRFKTPKYTINGIKIYQSIDGQASYIGNPSYKLPKSSNIAEYNDSASEKWYNDRSPIARFKISTYKTKPYKLINFISYSYDNDINDTITNYWNFGDKYKKGDNVSHKYTKEGYYKITLTSKDKYNKVGLLSKTIKIGNPRPDLYINKIKHSNKLLKITIKNKGTHDSKKFYVRAWYGKDSSKKYKQIAVKSLKKNKSVTIKIKNYKYKNGKIKVDYYNKISEKNESNNIKKF